MKALAGLLIALLSAVSAQPAFAQDQAGTKRTAGEYESRIKPIFESRCIACHSCYNAPCQLNLQSHSGAARGAIARNVYDATRAESVPPTRLDIDASTTSGWREKGFFDVLGAGNADKSLLLRLARLRSAHPEAQPAKQAAESQLCVADVGDKRIAENEAALGMPYGLPPLATSEIAALETWIADGTPAPNLTGKGERNAIPQQLLGEVHAWEHFLNTPEPRHKLVSRYLYEHLFLGHLYFASGAASSAEREPAKRPAFFRLVRSRTACDAGIDEIATRRPTDAPGTPEMFYCLRPLTGAIVEKTHIPYGLSPGKLERIKTQFLGTSWTVNRTQAYSDDLANNPFATFADIPVKARYQFLLDDAEFHVATFIKGPVCNGTEAVNSIQEQFFVFFLRPEADSMVVSPEHAAAAESKLVLPGAWGSDISLLSDLPFLNKLIHHREEYRRFRAESVRQLRPLGYSLDDIWDGDGENSNALLTVLRHDDNAAVVKGAVGDLPKTVFVLDYPLFERLVYNLVVNFDVFGNIGHQVLTRIYMDLIRMEAEELFLSFLPPAERQPLRRRWYRGGLLTKVKLDYVFPLIDEVQPTAVVFHAKRNHKAELVQRVLFERLPAKVRGPADALNWRALKVPAGAPSAASLPPAEQALRRIASIAASGATPFARYLPELAILLLRRADGGARLYSLVHNREHENVSWITGESLRAAPLEDTLTIGEGVLGAYPSMIFVVDEAEAAAFSDAVRKITSPDGYRQLVERFGVKRSSGTFWAVFDEINQAAQKRQPLERGTLDLTRYDLAPN
jgi:hypothetical protein